MENTHIQFIATCAPETDNIENIFEKWLDIAKEIRKLNAGRLSYVIFDINQHNQQILCQGFIDLIKTMCKVDEIVFRDTTELPFVLFTLDQDNKILYHKICEETNE